MEGTLTRMWGSLNVPGSAGNQPQNVGGPLSLTMGGWNRQARVSSSVVPALTLRPAPPPGALASPPPILGDPGVDGQPYAGVMSCGHASG